MHHREHVCVYFVHENWRRGVSDTFRFGVRRKSVWACACMIGLHLAKQLLDGVVGVHMIFLSASTSLVALLQVASLAALQCSHSWWWLSESLEDTVAFVENCRGQKKQQTPDRQFCTQGVNRQFVTNGSFCWGSGVGPSVSKLSASESTVTEGNERRERERGKMRERQQEDGETREERRETERISFEDPYSL